MYDGLPMLNLGCGKVILPAERPAHHALIDEAIYSYPQWVNVDRNDAPGVDKIINLLEYPWPLESNAYGGALLTHFVEHIPHEIKIAPIEYPHGIPATHAPYKNVDLIHEMAGRQKRLGCLQDGWFAFFAELYRVLAPGAIVHILSPYAWSAGAIADPTHTRLITEHTFTHQLSKSDQNNAFYYATDCNFEMVQSAHFSVTEMFAHLVIQPGDTEAMIQRKRVEFQDALMTRLNVCYEIYVQLRAVKP